MEFRSWCEYAQSSLGAWKCLQVGGDVDLGTFGKSEDSLDFTLPGCFPSDFAAKLGEPPKDALLQANFYKDEHSNIGQAGIDLRSVAPWLPNIKATLDQGTSVTVRVKFEDVTIQNIKNVSTYLIDGIEHMKAVRDPGKYFGACQAQLCGEAQTVMVKAVMKGRPTIIISSDKRLNPGIDVGWKTKNLDIGVKYEHKSETQYESSFEKAGTVVFAYKDAPFAGLRGGYDCKPYEPPVVRPVKGEAADALRRATASLSTEWAIGLAHNWLSVAALACNYMCGDEPCSMLDLMRYRRQKVSNFPAVAREGVCRALQETSTLSGAGLECDWISSWYDQVRTYSVEDIFTKDSRQIGLLNVILEKTGPSRPAVEAKLLTQWRSYPSPKGFPDNGEGLAALREALPKYCPNPGCSLSPRDPITVATDQNWELVQRAIFRQWLQYFIRNDESKFPVGSEASVNWDPKNEEWVLGPQEGTDRVWISPTSANAVQASSEASKGFADWLFPG